MRYTALVVLLGALVLSACSELVDAESWTSNRTFETWGGTVALDRLSVDVLGEGEVLGAGVPSGTHIRIVEADSKEVPSGALAESYSILLSGAKRLGSAQAVYQLDMEELPEGVYFVDVVLARVEAGEWEPIPSMVDPIAGQIEATIHDAGTYSVIVVQ